jgi:hypothetical protein
MGSCDVQIQDLPAERCSCRIRPSFSQIRIHLDPSALLVSCHIPKTAGVSFATSLGEVYREQFLWDRSHEPIIAAVYDENRFPVESVPIRWLNRYKPPALRGISCVHGHFPLRKYLPWAFNRNNIFIVWLREPLQWRISLYHFWKQLYPHPTEKYLNQIFDQDWDLERFCLDPTFDNYQSRYLAWFPRWRINFIGVTENYASDLKYLSQRVLHRELTLHKLNQTKKTDKSLERGFDTQFFRRFTSNNRSDYRNYQAARVASDARAMNGSWATVKMSSSPAEWRRRAAQSTSGPFSAASADCRTVSCKS